MPRREEELRCLFAIRSQVIGVLALAFRTDPGARWTWPDPQQYLTTFPEFVKAFGGKAFEHKSAYFTMGYTGAALWLPPNVRPDEAVMTALLQRTASAQIQDDLTGVFEKMKSFHPKEPHWYLPLMGVDPFLQGNGLGSALMKHALIACDHDNKLAFLESTNRRNVPLYERHGFSDLGRNSGGNVSHPLSMLRKPQPMP
jgi:GNAT superfamily N-acetyltransferase